MSSATEFLAEGLDSHHPYLLSIFIPEKGQGPLGHCILNAHDFGRHRLVFPHLVIHNRLDLLDISRRQGSEMSKVESQAIGSDERPVLFHVRAQHLAQRGMDQMGGGMISLSVPPRRAID